MKSFLKNSLLLGALAAGMLSATAKAQYVPFQFYFDENGNGTAVRAGVSTASSGFAQVDPNTGVNALTYALPSQIGSGVLDVLDATGALSDAISWYNANGTGFMAFYSLPGSDLADTISGGFVPTSSFHVSEVGDHFSYFSGGARLVNNDYYGTSTGVPDGGSTLALLGGAFALVGAARRKLS